MTRGTGTSYVDGPRLRRALLAAADWVAAGRDELNRVNVFPVPDGDTGTNLRLTLHEVAQALRELGDAPLPSVTATMARRSRGSSRACAISRAGSSRSIISSGWCGRGVSAECGRGWARSST